MRSAYASIRSSVATMSPASSVHGSSEQNVREVPSLGPSTPEARHHNIAEMLLANITTAHQPLSISAQNDAAPTTSTSGLTGEGSLSPRHAYEAFRPSTIAANATWRGAVAPGMDHESDPFYSRHHTPEKPIDALDISAASKSSRVGRSRSQVRISFRVTHLPAVHSVECTMPT